MNEPGHIDEDEAEAMSLRAGSVKSLMAVAIAAVTSAALFWLSSVVLKEAAAARRKASAASGEPE
jgi:hypothetical protein